MSGAQLDIDGALLSERPAILLAERHAEQEAALLDPPAFSLVVYGRPAPQGSKSFKGMSKKGHAIMVESSKHAAPWRGLVYQAAVATRAGAAPLDGALAVRMVFTLPKPASSPKTRRIWPDRMPDLSKLARAVEDALVNAGALADDARIVEYARLAKVYPNEDAEALEAPGVRVSIWRVTA